jgi:hypothetical protein
MRTKRSKWGHIVQAFVAETAATKMRATYDLLLELAAAVVDAARGAGTAAAQAAASAVEEMHTCHTSECWRSQR